MGDMADFLIEQIEDMAGFLDDMDHMDDNYQYTVADKRCRCCGEGGLRWGQVDGKFRLFKGEKLHMCPVNPLR